MHTLHLHWTPDADLTDADLTRLPYLRRRSDVTLTLQTLCLCQPCCLILRLGSEKKKTALSSATEQKLMVEPELPIGVSQYKMGGGGGGGVV